MQKYIEAFKESLLTLDRIGARRIFEDASQEGEPLEFVETVMAAVLEDIGLSWEVGTIALSQVYMSGRICEELLDSLLPLSVFREENPCRVAIAVLEDYHMLGKRIVASVLRSSGYPLVDYGRVSVDELVRFLATDQIEILLVSTLMLPAALRVKNLQAALKERAIRVKVIVGGAPFRFDPLLWQEVGADGVGRNAGDAVALVRQFTEKTS
ncbi:cobalamin B12-binding domain-containing protein [Desulfoplanes sp.]